MRALASSSSSCNQKRNWRQKKEKQLITKPWNGVSASKEFGKAKEYFKKALLLSEESGFCEDELNARCNLTKLMLFEGDVNGARSHLFATISKLEYMRSFLKDNDKFKLSFTDRYASCYLVLSALYCETGSRDEALSLVEP